MILVELALPCSVKVELKTPPNIQISFKVRKRVVNFHYAKSLKITKTDNFPQSVADKWWKHEID